MQKGFGNSPRVHSSGGTQPPHDARPAVQNAAPLQVSYFDNGRIRPALFRGEAEKHAQRLMPVDPTQLRRFFNAVERLRRRLPRAVGGGVQDRPTDQNRFGPEELKAELALLEVRARYAAARDKKHQPLAEFIAANVRAVEGDKDPVRAFRHGFRPHFEAVVGLHAALRRAGSHEEGV
ncbi:MAG: type III-A CRISPR-associated protein Csm2 [Elioraea sp.]|nr:type III-A CRISPR-associated protein Csm2 [Elioraea sp.]